MPTKILRLLSLSLSLSLCWGLQAQARPIDHRYPTWNVLTGKHVRWLPDQVQSRTNYAGFQADRVQLHAALAEMSAMTQTEFDQTSSTQQMAFLINAYNAFTVELILSKYPKLTSIKDLGSVFQSPWKKKFFVLLGAQRSLDWIENDMLRARYKDPRIHVGINCASIGCPALRAEAFVATKLDAQLDDSMQRFLADKTRNRYLDGKLEVSEIFKWFAQDFEQGNRDLHQVADLFARHAKQFSADPAVQAALRAKTVPISYLPYDWQLNDAR